MTSDILKHIEVIIENKSYIGVEISSNPKVFKHLKRNQIHIPMSVFEDVKSENGIIVMEFKNNEVVKGLKNVSETLMAKFLSEHNRGFLK